MSNRNRITYIIISGLLIFLLPVVSLAAQSGDGGRAVVREVSGTVFIKNSAGSWRAAAEGGLISADEWIITGSRSILVLQIGRDEVVVEGYTKIQLKAVRGDNAAEATRVNISSGSLRARVKTAGGARNRERFTVQSPLATASVRGTDFVFNGTELVVYEGDVQLRNVLGQKHSVRAGQESRAYGLERITSVEEVLKEGVLLVR